MSLLDPLSPAETRRLRAALAALPDLQPADGWRRLSMARHIPLPRPARALIGTMAIAGALALLVLGALLRQFDGAMVSSASAAEIATLQARSAALESRLAALPERRLVRGGSALTTVALQDRILLVDEQLSDQDVRRRDVHARALWQERCELLNTLLKVRAASAADITF